MKGLRTNWPESVVDCFEEGLFEAREGSRMRLEGPHR